MWLEHRGVAIRWFWAVALAFSLSACADRNVSLFNGLSQVEANRLVAFLDMQGIQSRKLQEREGLAVTVGSSDLARASMLATQAGLPRAQYKGFGAVFPKDGLISSPLEERARLTFAISQELESMLGEMDGVLGARVNVVVPERRNGRYVELPSAAVLIRHRSDIETDLLEMKVRRLVASSVPGLVEGDDRQISVSFMGVQSGRLATHAATSVSADMFGASSPGSAALAGDVAASIATTISSVPSAASDSAPAQGAPQKTSRPVTLFAVILGVLSALVLFGWMLRAQIVQLFRPERAAARPA